MAFVVPEHDARGTRNYAQVLQLSHVLTVQLHPSVFRVHVPHEAT